MESIKRIVPNILSDKMEESRKFYAEFLGLKVAMDMGWIITLVSPDNPTAQISLVRSQEAIKPDTNFSLTIEVKDVDDVHTKALAGGIKIIYPLTDEPWGVRRFHVADPNGVVVNIMSHRIQKQEK
jgi:predicted enzyme related to lactoylglutathione lyase